MGETKNICAGKDSKNSYHRVFFLHNINKQYSDTFEKHVTHLTRQKCCSGSRQSANANLGTITKKKFMTLTFKKEDNLC